MLWETALSSVIEVAIALAGFSGIVAAVGRRGAGQWSAFDQLALRILLASSGAAVIFAYLPFILVDLMEDSIAWRILSAILATWLSGIVIFRIRQMSHTNIPDRNTVRNPYVAAAAILFTSILVANALWFASPALYLAGMLWLMMVPFLTFVGLLLSSWRPLEDEPPPAN